MFLGYEDCVGIFWESSRNWTSFRGHFYALSGIILRYRIEILFWVGKFSTIFGVLDIPDIFG